MENNSFISFMYMKNDVDWVYICEWEVNVLTLVGVEVKLPDTLQLFTWLKAAVSSAFMLALLFVVSFKILQRLLLAIFFPIYSEKLN